MMMKKLLVLVAALAMMMLMMAAPAMADDGSDGAFWYGYNTNNGYKVNDGYEDCYFWFGPDYFETHASGHFNTYGAPTYWHSKCMKPFWSSWGSVLGDLSLLS
jgi:hypothetical protein